MIQASLHEINVFQFSDGKSKGVAAGVQLLQGAQVLTTHSIGMKLFNMPLCKADSPARPH